MSLSSSPPLMWLDGTPEGGRSGFTTIVAYFEALFVENADKMKLLCADGFKTVSHDNS